tara:strand:- start:1280 stop:2071 length:792 start_codon:yes stop_codon:yes gene_type:complete
MIQSSIKLISSIIFIASVVILIGFHSQNRNLIKFNKIILKGNNHLSSELFFKIIGYNVDNIESYNQEMLDLFLSKIYDLENYDIIKDLHISYSLPDKIVVNINERKPVYIINNKINTFAIDDNGQIFNIDFLSDNIHQIELDFLVYGVYNNLNNNYQLKDLFSNINNNKINNNYLLNGIDLLSWFNKINFSTNIKSLLIEEHIININLEKTKIIFEHNNLDRQFVKLKEIINNQTFLDTLKINQISDLSEINLSFNNQIILKR